MAYSKWKNPHLKAFSEARVSFLNGQSTPRDFLEECLNNLFQREDQVKAFVDFDIEAARRAADESTKRYREAKPWSAVDGCPFGVKDIINTRSLPTRMGSPSHANYQPFTDAACVDALLTGGAILVGKTVTTEFAIGSARETTNPFDQLRTPGGSSSGSGASVGAGMLPLALTTQTQASGLRPASYCGAYGFKATLNTLRTDGVHIMSPTSDHVGLITGSLEDAWLSASRIGLAVGGNGTALLQRAGQPIVAQKPKRLIRLYTRGWDEMNLINPSIKGALPEISIIRQSLSSDMSASQKAFELFMEQLAKADIEILDRHNNEELHDLEQFLDETIERALELVIYEMQWPFRDYVRRFGDLIGPRIHQMMETASQMTPADYMSLLSVREEFKKRLTATFQSLNADCFILPATTGHAPLGIDYTGSRTFPSYANFAGFPALCLPILSADGLPFGVQLFHLEGRDADLCCLGRWVDEM